MRLYKPGVDTALWETTNDPSVFGFFTLHEQLGAGGAGTVHRASWTDPTDGEVLDVALKRLHPRNEDRPDLVEAFVDEARISASLDHRNVCRFLDSGRLDGQTYIALEYIRGHKLGRILRRAVRVDRPPPIDVAVYLIGQLCDALDHVHHVRDRGTGRPLNLVHGDVAPSNIVISEDGELKLIDFGVARSALDRPAKRAGAIRGTLGYVAPEVVCGMTTTASADIFAAGIIAWELLTAQRLFADAKTKVEALDRAFLCRVRPPSELNPACPPALETVVMRALSRLWRDRWDSAGAMARAVRSVATAEGLRPRMAAVRGWVNTLRAAH